MPFSNLFGLECTTSFSLSCCRTIRSSAPNPAPYSKPTEQLPVSGSLCLSGVCMFHFFALTIEDTRSVVVCSIDYSHCSSSWASIGSEISCCLKITALIYWLSIWRTNCRHTKRTAVTSKWSQSSTLRNFCNKRVSFFRGPKIWLRLLQPTWLDDAWR